jgi:hypothetical protein
VDQCRFGGELLLMVSVHAHAPMLMMLRNAYFTRAENDCARFRGHSLHHINPEESLLLLSGLLLAGFLLG